MATARAFPRKLAEFYLCQDPRNLGLFRIVLGVLFMSDVVFRYPHARTFYSNDGVLSNHFALFRPPCPHFFSVFLGFSRPDEVRLLLILTFLSAALFTLGLYTRTAQVFAVIAITSLHARNPLLDGPADMVVRLLAVWSLFLPLGRRFSLDALARSLATFAEHTAADLNGDRRRLRDETPVLSLAVLALSLELATIAFLRRPELAAALSSQSWAALLSKAVYVLQCAAGALILVPFARRPAKKVALVGLSVVALSLVAMGDDPAFAAALIAFLPLYLEPRDWEWLQARIAQKRPKVRVVYDQDCGICLLVCRILVRLDVGDRLEFAGNDDADLPSDTVRRDADRTVLAVNEATGEIQGRSAAVAMILRALWFGRPFAAILSARPFVGMADGAYDLVARNRHRISAWMGYAACGVPSKPSADDGAHDIAHSPARARLLRTTVREIAACALLALCAFDVAWSNGWASGARPEGIAAPLEYPRLSHAFRHPLDEKAGTVVVEGLTVDRRQVDVLAAKPLGQNAASWGGARNDRLWGRYLTRLGEDRYSDYREELRRYLVQRAALVPALGRLVRIDAYLVPASDALGSAAERKLLFSHQFPGAGS